MRAFLADASQFDDAKQAQSFVGLNPSNWSSGQMAAPSRAITKEGPGVLRLAFYQAGNVARTVDPQLAEFYRRLMVERGHCHTQASCAVARKLVARTWATLTSGRSYQLRDLDGQPITRRRAKRAGGCARRARRRTSAVTGPFSSHASSTPHTLIRQRQHRHDRGQSRATVLTRRAPTPKGQREHRAANWDLTTVRESLLLIRGSRGGVGRVGVGSGRLGRGGTGR